MPPYTPSYRWDEDNLLRWVAAMGCGSAATDGTARKSLGEWRFESSHPCKMNAEFFDLLVQKEEDWNSGSKSESHWGC